MEQERKIEIATTGGCGLVALEVLRLRPTGIPVLWYDEDGNAVHAAVKIGRQLVHLGSRETGYIEVSVEELRRAVREDFNSDRPDATDQEIAEIASELVEDF